MIVVKLSNSILLGNTLHELVNTIKNNYPSNVSAKHNCGSRQRMNAMSNSDFVIYRTPPLGHPALISTLQPNLVHILPRVRVTLTSVIQQIAIETDSKLIILLHAEIMNYID